MKRFFLLLTVACIAMAACENNEGVGDENITKPVTPKIEISEQFIETDFNTNTYTISVNATHSWEIATKGSWIKVNTLSGDAGTYKIGVVIMQNTENEPRNGSVIIKNEEYDLVAELHITQGAFVPEISIDPQHLNFSPEGETQKVLITSNFSYEASTNAEWVTFSKTVQGLTITTPTYNDSEMRYAEIIISNKKYNVSEVINITQDAFVPNITIENQTISFTQFGGAKQVVISTNIDYEVHTNVDWLSFEKISSGLVITATASDITEKRSAEITIANSKYNISKTITITQRPISANISDEQFKRRSLIIEFAGLNCLYCLDMRKALDSISAEEEYNDIAVRTAIHSDSWSPDKSFVVYHDDNLDLATALGITAFPTYWVDWIHQNSNAGLSNNIKNIKKYLDIQQASPAKAGIAARMQIVNNKVRIQTAVAATCDGDYYVGAWLLENGLQGVQAGATDPAHDTHNNVVRVADSHPEGSPNGNYYGHPLGTLSQNDVVEYSFEMDLKENWKAENCYAVIFISHYNNSTKTFEITNVIRSKSLSDFIDFEYVN